MYTGPNIITNGLVLSLDAANTKSYPGSGTTWFDKSGNGNNGTLTNGPTFSTDKGGTLVFTAANSNYVTLGNSKFQYQDNFTVEAVCRFTAVPNNAAVCAARHPIIYNHDYGYNLFIGATGNLFFQVFNTVSANVNISSINSLIGQNYFHVVGTKSGTTVTLYINSILQNSATLSSNAVYYINEPFVIGGFAVCGGNRFYANGNIAIVKVYNKALLASEVLQNYNGIKSRFGL